MKRKEGRSSRPAKQEPSERVFAATSTPIRGALLGTSSLLPLVKDGLGAIESTHRDHLAQAIRPGFSDSLNLDEGVLAANPQSNRWDYLLGHKATGTVIGVEPHSAKMDQISVVIAKREAAKHQLRGHLRAGAKVVMWIWVASGRVDFLPFDRAKRRLDEAGVTFAGGQVKAKDLKGLASSSSR